MLRYPLLRELVCRSMQIHFDNTYARLPERFFAKQGPARVAEPKLIRLNLGLAAQLSMDIAWLQSADGLAMLAGNATGPPEPRSPSCSLSAVASAGMKKSIGCRMPPDVLTSMTASPY